MQGIDAHVVERATSVLGHQAIVAGGNTLKGERAEVRRDLSNGTTGHQINNATHSRMPPSPSCFDEVHPSSSCLGKHQFSFVLRHDHRLLAQHMLAVGNACGDPRKVSIVMEADIDRFD